MKKIKKITVILVAIVLCTSCAVRTNEIDTKSDFYNTIYRGRNTHNFLVLANQNEQILKNQEKIIENQEKIIELLQR